MTLYKDVRSGKLSLSLRDQSISRLEVSGSIVKDDDGSRRFSIFLHKGSSPIIQSKQVVPMIEALLIADAVVTPA